MNKEIRHQIKMRKYRKRIAALGLTEEHYKYRTTGKPCSCPFCKKERYTRKIKHKNRP